MHLFPDNVSLWPLALVVLAASLFFALVLRALRRPVRVFPPGPPVVLASPRLADQAAREVNAIVAELRAERAALEQLHAQELAAVELRARRAEARAASAVAPAEVGQVIGALRTVAHDLADVATSLSGQVKALQRERAAARVEALTGKPLDACPESGQLASKYPLPYMTAEGSAALQRRDRLVHADAVFDAATAAAAGWAGPRRDSGQLAEDDREDDRKTAEHGPVQPTPADEWDDRTCIAEGSGRRPAIRPEPLTRAG